MKSRAISLLICLLALGQTAAHAASIVKVTYRQNTNTVGRMVYTGQDGGQGSDPSPYWALLTKAPQFAYEVKIEPDKPGGRTATLNGNISVSIQIRNKIDMGTVKTQNLTLVRDDAKTNKWFLKEQELKRIRAIQENMEKNSAGPVGLGPKSNK